ncbi:MAG: sensor histidine kinase [Cyanophyceae cyanobacterium]
MNLSQVLKDRTDLIIQDWVEAVRQNSGLKSPNNLTYEAVRNSLPSVLETLSNILSSKESNIGELVQSSIKHGALRAQQGYDPEEVAREYRILRQTIFSHLEPQLLTGTVSGVLEAVRVIDTTVDEIIAICFKYYTQKRLQDLEELSNQLELTNQELTRFVESHQDNLSHLAHELKNPLTSIIGYSELFLRQQKKQIEGKPCADLKHIEKVMQNGRQILHLINDTLEVSRYKSGQMKLRPAPTDICAVINSVIEVLEPIAEKKGLQLSIACALSSKLVITDALRLQQVLTNLISNAIRYTETGLVKVVCEVLTDNQLSITISDTGIGIEPAEQQKIFAPFYRARSNGHHAPDSTGLGLTIVSQLVKLLQGDIQLVSQVGEGTTFTITLPLRVQVAGEV